VEWLAAQAIGIATAIPALVMGQGDGMGGLQQLVFMVADDVSPHLRVLFHQFHSLHPVCPA
jgi:hypothetical protein